MADMNVTGQNPAKIDSTKWKKLTPQEIIREEGNGEEVPAEILKWAQQMAAFAKIPDNVTYDKVDGDTGIEALNKLGIAPEEEVKPEDENAEKPVETEEPDAVQDATKTEETPEEDENIFAAENPETAPKPQPEAKAETEENPDETLTLADNKITTDNEEILKRKRKKGQPEG